jgi:hypothetical protein
MEGLNAGTHNAEQSLKVVAGPTKFARMVALFDHTINNHRPVGFSLENVPLMGVR